MWTNSFAGFALSLHSSQRMELPCKKEGIKVTEDMSRAKVLRKIEDPPSDEKIRSMAKCDTSSALTADFPEITMSDVGKFARAYLRHVPPSRLPAEPKAEPVEERACPTCILVNGLHHPGCKTAKDYWDQQKAKEAEGRGVEQAQEKQPNKCLHFYYRPECPDCNPEGAKPHVFQEIYRGCVMCKCGRPRHSNIHDSDTVLVDLCACGHQESVHGTNGWNGDEYCKSSGCACSGFRRAEHKEAVPVRCHCGVDVCAGVDRIPAGVFCAREKEAAPEAAGTLDEIGRECIVTRDTHRLLTETSEDFADRMRRTLIAERRQRTPEPAIEGAPETDCPKHIWIASYTASQYAGILSRGLLFRSIHDSDEEARKMAHDPRAEDFSVTEYIRVDSLHKPYKPKAEGAEKAHRPVAQKLPDGDKGTWRAYLASEAEAYMDALESRNTDLEYSTESWHMFADQQKERADKAESRNAELEKEVAKLSELRGLDADAYVSLNETFRKHIYDVVKREEKLFADLGLNTSEGRNFNERAEKAEREVQRLTQQSANVYFNEGVDAAIAFVMGGRFLSDEAPTAQFSREVAANLPRIKRVESSPYAQKVVDGMPKPGVSDNFIQSRIYWGRAEGTGDVGIYEELQAWRVWAAARVEK